VFLRSDAGGESLRRAERLIDVRMTLRQARLRRKIAEACRMIVDARDAP
jgi:hypothetical protein